MPSTKYLDLRLETEKHVIFCCCQKSKFTILDFSNFHRSRNDPNLRVETLKTCGGFTFGSNAPDGATFSPLVIPAQGVLHGRLLGNSRTRVASCWALVMMIILSLSTAPKYRRGFPCLETTSNNDDATSCSTSGPYPPPVTPGSHRFQLVVFTLQPGQAAALGLVYSLYRQRLASL